MNVVDLLIITTSRKIWANWTRLSKLLIKKQKYINQIYSDYC